MRAAIIAALTLLAAGCSAPAETLECDPGAPLLAQAAACDDGRGCTFDVCDGGACDHVRMHFCPEECDPDAAPKEQAAACDDGDECTAERCLEGSCVYSKIGGCR